MSSYRIKVNPNDPSSISEGRIDYARLDATTEEEIRNQEAQDANVGNAHIGTTLDSLLEEDGVLEQSTGTPMKRTRLKIKTTREFFERGRRIAQAADQGLPLTEAFLLALGDSASLKNVRSKRKRKSKIVGAVHESAKG